MRHGTTTHSLTLQSVRWIASFRSPHILPVCLLLGIAARLAVVLLVPVEPVSDAAWYFNRAREIANGNGYQEAGYPTAFWPIGYPALLSSIYWILGPSVVAGQLLNVACWTLCLLLLYGTTRRITGSLAAANIAVLLYSLHLNSLAYSALLLTECVYTALLVGCAWCIVAFRGWPRTISCGVILGLLTLVKAQTWLFGSCLAFVVAAIDRDKSRRTRALQAAAVVIAMFSLVLPWSARNYRVLGEFVLVSTNGGIAFAVGNHPNSNGSDAWLTNPFREEIGQSVADQLGVDRRAKELTWRWIRANPGAFASLIPKKLYWAFLPDGEGEWGFQAGYKAYDTHRSVIRSIRWTNQVYYLALLVATLAAALWLFKRWKTLSPSAKYFLAFAGTYLLVLTVQTIIFNGQSRYHFPLVPVMTVLCAAAIRTSYHWNDSWSEPLGVDQAQKLN